MAPRTRGSNLSWRGRPIMASSLSRASGAREIEDDLLGLGVFLVQFLFDNAVGMQELARDVGENGGAAGRDAAFGGLDEQAREEFAQVLGRGELGEVVKEVFREIFGVNGC